jgi:hypothetical protein
MRRKQALRGGPAGAMAWALLWTLVASAGCQPDDSYQVTLDPMAPVASPDPRHEAAPPRIATPPALAAVRGETVVGRTGPGGEPFEVAIHTSDRPGHDRRIGRRTFEISLRGTPSTTDACDSCHRPGRPVIQTERIEDAHRYILPRHPEESGTHCITCHAPDDVERLILASGERIEMGHAYRLCAQCHFQQVDDWAAGIHGKRLDGWRGRRVLMGCADCHDPHGPAIEPRVPFPGPQLPRTGRRSP